jgi:hypothetical protein
MSKNIWICPCPSPRPCVPVRVHLPMSRFLLLNFRKFIIVPDTASYIRGWMQMIYFPRTINTVSTGYIIMLHTLQWFIVHPPAMHIDLLCACWYSWAVKGSSSWSFCCLLISLRLTSYLLLSPKLTDAPYSDSGARPPHPLSRWRLHSQGPHTFPSQGTRQLSLWIQ